MPIRSSGVVKGNAHARSPRSCDVPGQTECHVGDSLFLTITMDLAAHDVSAHNLPSPSPGPPSNKRRRVESDDAGDTFTQATRHPRFWYHDGSIVLHVENTLFRVHQSVISLHSEVFADMLAVPQPVGEDQLEGCHIVRLHDDTALDWEKLLVVLYDALYVPCTLPSVYI